MILSEILWSQRNRNEIHSNSDSNCRNKCNFPLNPREFVQFRRVPLEGGEGRETCEMIEHPSSSLRFNGGEKDGRLHAMTLG